MDAVDPRLSFYKSEDGMKVLIVQTGFLGDTILSTPAISAARELFPQAELHLLTTPAAAPLFRNHPQLARVSVFDKRGKRSGLSGLFAMARELRLENYAQVFSLHKSARTALLLWLARIPLRYGFSEAALRFLYTKTAPRKDLPHDVLRNLAIFRVLGREPQSFLGELELPLSPEVEAEAKKLLGPGDAAPLVVIAPGSVWATKRWRIEGFAEVVEGLLKKGYRIVVIGGPEDAALGKRIREMTIGKLLDLTGRTSLLVSAAVIKQSALLITNDSAPLHLASSTKTPTVAIFCATVPEFGFGPWRNKHELVGVNGLACRPCGRHGGNSCPIGTLVCQTELAGSTVLAAAERLLS